MPVTQVKQAMGSFEVKLYPTVPKAIINQLKYLGHIAVIEGRIDPVQYGDNILDAARYVGVYRNRVNDVDNRTNNVVGSYLLRGVGMAYWLGDEDGKGHVIEAPGQTFSGQTFANTVRALLPDSVAEGTLYSVAGTYSNKHVWESPRKAITYVCDTFEAEWRVNNDGSLDAGTVDQLYNPTPTAMLVKHQFGRDLSFAGYEGKIDSAEDIEDFTTRIVLLAQGEGESIATGSADINPSLNTYKDLFGNSVVLTRLVSESTTTATNADTRAEIALQEFDSTRRSIRLAANDFDVAGTLKIGEYIYVFDPDTGLFDAATEIQFRGQWIYPVKFRCVELTWPISEGMTVAYRDPDGVWVDLTDWVNFEGNDVAITIGELPRSLTGGFGEPIGTRPSDDGSIPAAPTWITPFFTSSYLDGMGNTRARVFLTWNQPLNVDGSTILDGDRYEINYGLNPVTTEWQVHYVAWDTEETLISDLGPGLTYDIRIRAVDRYGHAGAWSVVEAITVSPDTIPPSTPAAPTVAGSLIAVQVSHTLGKASGGTFNLEVDLDHLEVHLGTTNTFTPSSSTIIGKLNANYGMMQGAIAAVATFPTSETALRWIRVIAVDEAGNKSSPSPAASVTAQLIDNAHISDLTVSKVTAGTISADWIVGARIKTADTGQRVEMNTSGIQMYNSGNVLLTSLQTNGVWFLRSGTSGARIDISTVTGIQIYNSGGVRTGWLDIDGDFELRSAASGARIHLDATGFRAFNSGGTETVTISNAGSFTLRSGSSGSRIEIDTNGLRTYNSSGQQSVDIKSNGDVSIVGTIASGYPGEPRLFFNADILGKSILYEPVIGGLNDSAWIRFEEYNGGTGRGIDLISSIDNASPFDGRRSEGYIIPAHVMFINAGGLAEEARLRLGYDGDVNIRGKYSIESSGATFAAGAVTVSGNGGTIFYGVNFNSNPHITAMVRAGNNAAFNITGFGTDQFSWAWSGPSLSAGADYILWCGART